MAQEMLIPMTPKTQAGPSVVTGVTGVTGVIGKNESRGFCCRRRCSEPIMGCLL